MKDKRMWAIFLIIFTNMLGFGIILPLLPYYVESFGAGPVMIGLIAAFYSLFQLLSAPILGELSDRFGRRPILLFSMGGTALSFAVMGLAKSLPILFLARIIDGASGGNLSTAQAYIADITTKENRTKGMGIMMAGISLGIILGPVVGGLLSQFGYSVPAYVACVVALIATVMTFFFLPESNILKSKPDVKKRGKIFSFRDFRDALTHPNIGLFLTISFMMMFAFSLMQGTFALFTKHSLHLSIQTNGYLFAYLGLVGIVIQMFFLKKILKHISENIIIVWAIVLLAVSMALIAFSQNLSNLFVAVTILAFANSISGPVLAGLISKKTSENEQGNIAGVNQSVGSVARLTGPIIGTTVYGIMGMKAPYVMAVAILTFTAIYSAKNLVFANKEI
jgi:DHA1 family tetracycline resistance protein-like MFS transporter